ncbi:hypothetical protein ACVIHC_002187 [Bradyrhizobium diazoefficiens]
MVRAGFPGRMGPPITGAVGSAAATDVDAQAWISAGANADPTRASNLFKALKAVGFTTSNAFADIKAAGGTIQLYRGLNSVGATVPDLCGTHTATPGGTFATATGSTLNGTNQFTDSGYTVVQAANFFAILFCNHITFTNNDGLISDADAATPAFDVIQRTGNVFRTTVTKVGGTTGLRDSVAAYSTGIDYQHGFRIASQSGQPYSNVVSAQAFTTDGTALSIAADMRAANGTLKLGRSGTNYGNIQVHAFIAAPLAPTAAQLQNLVDAIEVFWS